ncbi:MAG: hypothetical protein AB8H86_24445 [Polyangiales bacterium]
MNAFAAIGVVVNALVLLAAIDIGEFPALTVAFALFWLLSLAGVVVVLAGQRKAGAYMIMAGSALFVPIGIIGLLGARQILDKITEEDFHK